MTETNVTKKWNDDTVAQLTGIVGAESPVTVATLESAAETLGFSVRSVASKLRNLEFEVESTAKAATSAFSAEETESLKGFVQSNQGAYTYKEIAANFAGGKFNAKQVQGKILSLELTEMVKPAEKIETARTYTEAQEQDFVALASQGKFIEEIAEALGKTVQSVRGKALSLLHAGSIDKIPAQKESKAKAEVDALAGLNCAEMTVEEIAEKTGKTERGIKTTLTRRGIDAANYKGSEKKAKAEAKKAAA